MLFGRFKEVVGNMLALRVTANGSCVRIISPWFCPWCQWSCCKSADSRSEFLCVGRMIYFVGGTIVVQAGHPFLFLAMEFTSAGTDLQSSHMSVFNLL